MVTAELIDLETVCAIHVAPWWLDHAWEVEELHGWLGAANFEHDRRSSRAHTFTGVRHG